MTNRIMKILIVCCLVAFVQSQNQDPNLYNPQNQGGYTPQDNYLNNQNYPNGSVYRPNQPYQPNDYNPYQNINNPYQSGTYPNNEYQSGNYPNRVNQQNYPVAEYPQSIIPQSNYPQSNYPQSNYPQGYPPPVSDYPLNYPQSYPNDYSGGNPYNNPFSPDGNNRYDDINNEIDLGGSYGRPAYNDIYSLLKCPKNWVRYLGSCYRFMKSPLRARNDARRICQAYEADLVSINTVEEHGFIINQLMKIDPQHRMWYISARQTSPQYWANEADGSQLSNMENAFLNEHVNRYGMIENLQGRDFLVYKFSDISKRWGFEQVDGFTPHLFICEAQIDRVQYLIEEDRDYTYGIEIRDPERIARGPYFITEPVDTIYDVFKSQRIRYVELTCIAGGYPAPTYKWFREDFEFDKLVSNQIDPLKDDRFTISGGSLIIYDPDALKDSAKYHCTATNTFGTIRSESVLLSFGFIREFNLKRPSETGNQYWGKVMYCDPPPYYPAINYNWARNSFPDLVDEDQRVFVSFDGGLYFSALETIDRGNYSCNVQSKDSHSGRNGPFFPLYVYPHSDYQQLKFPNNFPKVFPEAPIVGQEVRLECVSFGYPVPSYNWTRKNSVLPRQSYQKSFSRVLIIPHVSVEDEGEYVCNVRNDRAAISNSVFLRVQAYPNFTIPIGDKHMDNKGDLTWTCEAFGIPDVNYTWWRNGEKLLDTLEMQDRERYIVNDNVLSIKYLDPTRDPAMYQCEARNQLKSAFSSGQLRVLSLKPSFKKRPLEIETLGAEGGNVTIRCNPEAAPKPQFTWKKDGQIIGSGGKRQIMENGNLFIRQLSRDDEGFYTCQAKNQYGIDESLGRLIVLRAPRFIDPLPPRVNAFVRENIFLHCRADTDYLLDHAYIWLHNGMRLREYTDPYADNRLKIDGGELTIFNVSLADVGIYECVLNSAVGRINTRTTLVVEGPPGPPGGVEVQNIQKNSVTLEWTDGPVNGRPITHYIVSGRTNWNSTWLNISEYVIAREFDRYNARKQALLENELAPWSVYEFRVQAVNIFGIGEPSAPSPQFSTPAAPPTKPPQNVGGGGGKIGDLTITWTPLKRSEQNGPNIWYKIFWRRKSKEFEFQNLQLKEYGNIGMHVVHVSLENYYTPYEVKVQPFNEAGEGPESSVVTIFSAEDMPQAAPQNVVARSFNSTALNVSWVPIDQSRERIRGRLIGHRLKYWKQENREEECIYYLSRTTRPWALIVGLQPDTYYFTKVMAFNSAGEGPESERFLERTYRKAPQKPPASVQVFGVNPSTIRVVWRYVQPTTQEEPLIGYKVRVWEYDQDMSTANDTILYLSGKPLETYVYDLTPGKTYLLRVLAFSNGGDGRMSSPPFTFKMGDYRNDPEAYRNDGNDVKSTIFSMIIMTLFVRIFLL